MRTPESVSERRVNLKRREFLRAICAAPLFASVPIFAEDRGTLVNDVHTGLNLTWVDGVERPTSVSQIDKILKDCRKRGKAVSICGSRHATGGQQFAAHSVLLDMREMKRVLSLDVLSGILAVESGIEWPDLIHGYLAAQTESPRWGIRQKQGGSDHMSLGGALAANAHGHSLGTAPLIADVEWIDILTSDGRLQRCSRKKDAELFFLAIGGYGLFGVITGVGLRLVPRTKVRRQVETSTTAEAITAVEKRMAAGAPFGYFQYNIDETSLEFMRLGILTTYQAVPEQTALGAEQADLDEGTLVEFLDLGHQDRRSAFAHYAKLELSRNGNVEWSDLHQLSTYPAGYHKKIERRHGPGLSGADLIWEMYVPHDELIGFLEDARRLFLKSEMPLIYGTLRFIERDRDSFLCWAKKKYVCVIFTPHVSSAPQAMRKAAEVYRQLAQSATKRNGSFYLTYNHFAGRTEMAAAYPQFMEFLQLKKKYDPTELFQSEWYRHYRDAFA